MLEGGNPIVYRDLAQRHKRGRRRTRAPAHGWLGAPGRLVIDEGLVSRTGRARLSRRPETRRDGLAHWVSGPGRPQRQITVDAERKPKALALRCVRELTDPLLRHPQHIRDD